jgi:hypothetical protein
MLARPGRRNPFAAVVLCVVSTVVAWDVPLGSRLSLLGDFANREFGKQGYLQSASFSLSAR